jgi:hypothetical protein
VLAYRCLNNNAPAYLASDIQRVSDFPASNQGGGSALLKQLLRMRTTLGDRSFPVVAARAWNALPDSVTSVPSLLVFRRLLKTHLFCLAYYHGNWVYLAATRAFLVFNFTVTRSCSVFYTCTAIQIGDQMMMLMENANKCFHENWQQRDFPSHNLCI